MAIHEAWRLGRQQRRDAWLHTVASGDPGASERLPARVIRDRGAALELQLEPRAALQALAELSAAQREVMQRKAAGLSHPEIMAESAISHTAVISELL